MIHRHALITAVAALFIAAGASAAGLPPVVPSSAMAGDMPQVDVAKLAAAMPGANTQRRQAANVGDPGQRPVPQDIGAFREPCEFSHFNFDDPIVFPGQPGKSHLHVFFGNTGTDAYTTPDSVMKTGNSTCAGGTLNRTAYWAPAMIDMATRSPIVPAGSLFYYKSGYNGVKPADIKPFPAGLRMISGNAASKKDQHGPVRYSCVGKTGDNVWRSNIPAQCPAGNEVVMEIQFPQCWDGKNLDSPDHKSHMAYGNGNGGNGPLGCPEDHPVAGPAISHEIHYAVRVDDASANWRLSSDNYAPDAPGGWSGHGDWMMGWDAATMKLFVAQCLNKSVDCHAYLLGDGTMLY